jgi:hypothetical protein
MEISTSYSSVSLSYATLESETSLPAPDATRPAPLSDRVELSDEALQSARALEQKDRGRGGGSVDVVRAALAQLAGSDMAGIEATAVAEEATVTSESASLSVNGTISTKDGKDLGFTLDLQYDHLSYSAESAAVEIGEEGLSVEYGGLAAELTGTSFSFTMAGAEGALSGKGRLHLNDEVSRIGKEVKAAAKDFASAAGLSGGWGQINRFLRASTRQQLP